MRSAIPYQHVGRQFLQRLIVVCLFCTRISASVTRIVHDTDGVLDDAQALTLALNTDSVKVVAITTTHSTANSTQAYINVKRLLKLNDKEGIPVYKGFDEPLILTYDKKEPYFNGDDGFSDIPNRAPAAEPLNMPENDDNAPLALIKLSKTYPNLTIVATGALTNIALAQKMDAKFGDRIERLIIMGGNIYGIGNAVPNKSSEWNFARDPEAASIVLAEIPSSKIIVVPLEAFYINQESAKSVNFTEHFYYDTPLSKFFHDISRKMNAAVHGANSAFGYIDEIAMSVAIDEAAIVLESKNLHVNVELAGKWTRGQIVPDWYSRSFQDDNDLTKPKNGEIRFVTAYNVTLLNAWINSVFSCQ